MARIKRSEPVEQPKALVAAATRLKIKEDGDTARRYSGSSNGVEWQRAAWHFYDTVGEYRFACNWVGNLLSRAKLFATKDDGDGPRRVPSGEMADTLVDRLFDNEAGRAQMLRKMGIHYTVAGECYILGYEKKGIDRWGVVASLNMRVENDTWKWNGGKIPVDEGKNALVIRSWDEHPLHPNQSNSPSRSALPILSEIERLTMHVAAQVDSRLASAGVIILPSEISFASASSNPAQNGQSNGGSSAQFVQTMFDVMSTAISDRASAEALVPIILTAEGEHIDKIKHLTFWTELDEKSIELRTEAIRRLALSMDMPPEILTGAGDMNHWSAWAVDESSIKSHTEPLLSRIAADLAEGFLRPLLADAKMDPAEVRKYGIGIDTAEMRLRPNRSKEALELFDRGELTAETLRRETGFSELDAPSPQQVVQWFLKKVAGGSTTPDLVAQALQALGVPVTAPVDETVVVEETQEARPTPSLREHPDQSPPDEDAVTAAALVAASEQMVFRALERAGNRLKTKFNAQKMPGVEASELYLFFKCDVELANFALTDAWSKVGRFTGNLGTTPEALTPVLDSYCRALLIEQKPFDRDMLKSYLSLTRAGA